MRSTDRPAINDGVTRAMADRLVDTGADLGSVDETVRVLMEGRFLAREIVPRLSAAILIALYRECSPEGFADAA